MIYMHISDERDIAEAVRQLMTTHFEAGVEEGRDEVSEELEKLDEEMIELREVTNDRQDRIEYLESLLKENGIEFN